MWLTEGAEGAEPIPPLPTFTNEQVPRTTPEWLRRILNWRPVELHRIRTTPPTPTAPEDEGQEADRTPSYSTTCPDSESGDAASTATEGDDDNPFTAATVLRKTALDEEDSA